MVSKYFRGHIGTAGSRALRQAAHRPRRQHHHHLGRDAALLPHPAEDLAAFKAELTHLLVHQKMAINSPVWFNVGVEARPQCSAWFINSVEDTMSSIMDLAKTEAMLFKYGSGAGVNLSTHPGLRRRSMGWGGIASGPSKLHEGLRRLRRRGQVGAARRAARAKMVILDADHPDVMEFITSKASEERKTWALHRGRLDPSFTGEAYPLGLLPERQPLGPRGGRLHARRQERHPVVDPRPCSMVRPSRRSGPRGLPGTMAEPPPGCGDPGIQYDTIINDWHTSANSDRIYASNPCSEYMFLNDTACNLASLNLMKFVRDDGEFDIEAYGYAARLRITAQEILVDNASYPTPRIEENSHRFRPLGLGYANLGALLMSRGLAYDSDEGRHFAAALTAVMHGEAYRQSAIISREHGGPFRDYPLNEQPMLRVIAKHRDAAYAIPDRGAGGMLEATRAI